MWSTDFVATEAGGVYAGAVSLSGDSDVPRVGDSDVDATRSTFADGHDIDDETMSSVFVALDGRPAFEVVDVDVRSVAVGVLGVHEDTAHRGGSPATVLRGESVVVVLLPGEESSARDADA